MRCSCWPTAALLALLLAASWGPSVLGQEATAGEEASPPSPPSVGLLDNFHIFAGLDGSKAPDDLGINADFGWRAAFNWGVPLWEPAGLGLQLGSAFNCENTAVRFLPAQTATHDRTESFTTVGLFQRSSVGLNWGVVYDILSERYYTGIDLSQVRAAVGYQVTTDDEVGVWGALGVDGDRVRVKQFELRLRPINQVSIFWRHIWESGVTTRFWVGVAEEHSRFVLLAPGQSNIDHPILFGAELHAPLNDWLALWGEANFITPNDTGTVTAMLGIAIYPGAFAKRASRSTFNPMLPVSNNTSFAVDLKQ